VHSFPIGQRTTDRARGYRVFARVAMSLKVWWELCANDFIRQRCSNFIGDRAAAYGPKESESIPPELRETSFVAGSLDAATLASLRKICREKEITFHALLCSSLLLAYTKERSIRHPPAPFTTDRLLRGLVLFLVAVVATLLSATGPNKLVNYLASFLGIYAGVMSVHKLTELPKGFAHVTMESELLLHCAPEEADDYDEELEGSVSSSSSGASKSTPSKVPRRRCAGRVSLVADAESELWSIATTYHASLKDGWVENKGAGYRLAQVKSLAVAAPGGALVMDPHIDSFAKRLLLFRRVVLGLDSEANRGGRTVGLAVRQLPLPVATACTNAAPSSSFPAPSGSVGRELRQLPAPWITYLAGSKDGTCGGRDESLVGAGFSLNYSTGQDSGVVGAPGDTGDSQEGAQPAAAATAAVAAADTAPATALSLTLGFIQPKKKKGDSPKGGGGGGGGGVDSASSHPAELHASAVLQRAISVLEREVAPCGADVSLGAAATTLGDASSKKKN
jgi:hypothetical protein